MRVCLSCGNRSVQNPHGIATCPACRDAKEKECNRQYRLRHPEVGAARMRRWRSSEIGKSHIHSAAFKRAQQKYLATEKGKAMVRRRDARRRANLGKDEATLTAEEWSEVLDQNGWRCYYCGQSGPLTIDHRVPLVSGGKHTKANVVPACRSCNAKKGAREVVTDGYQMWDNQCPSCGRKSMQVVRPGKVQCEFCG